MLRLPCRDWLKTYNLQTLGSDLVAALADSDQALKLLPLNLEVRDTRGFIYLKLGDPALALNEYNAALTIDPWFRGGPRCSAAKLRSGGLVRSVGEAETVASTRTVGGIVFDVRIRHAIA